MSIAVSLFPFLFKIIECVVLAELLSYLQLNDFLDNNLSGHEAMHSMETALLAITEDLQAKESATFDTVNYQILISSLADSGIEICSLTCI